MSGFKRDNNAGLYLTIAFHLIVLIIFLIYSINTIVQPETSFVLDFTKQEQLEEEIRKQEFQESISKELDELISQAAAPRNVIVDANSPTKNSRNKEILDDARELQRKLDASRKEAEKYQESEDIVALEQNQKQEKAQIYKGPSVISYRLDGRKSISLPIPAYKCIEAGDVAVIISVNQRGYVKAARIIESVSSTDQCLQEYALKAAKRSRFTSSSTAPDRQAGEIVYRFVAQ